MPINYELNQLKCWHSKHFDFFASCPPVTVVRPLYPVSLLPRPAAVVVVVTVVPSLSAPGGGTGGGGGVTSGAAPDNTIPRVPNTSFALTSESI